MASFGDDFNRANGGLGSNWTTATGRGTFAIISNEVNGSTGTVCVVGVSTSTVDYSDDQEAECRYTVLGANDFAGPAVRLDLANATGYFLEADGLNSSGRRLKKFSGTTRTDIGTVGTIDVNVGDVAKLRAVGSTITLWINGVLIETITGETTYPTGQPGLVYVRNNSGATRVDDFFASDVVSSALTRLRFYMPSAWWTQAQDELEQATVIQGVAYVGSAVTRPRFVMPPTWWTEVQDEMTQATVIRGVGYVTPADYYKPRNPTVTIRPSVRCTPSIRPSLSVTPTISQ